MTGGALHDHRSLSIRRDCKGKRRKHRGRGDGEHGGVWCSPPWSCILFECRRRAEAGNGRPWRTEMTCQKRGIAAASWRKFQGRQMERALTDIVPSYDGGQRALRRGGHEQDRTVASRVTGSGRARDLQPSSKTEGSEGQHAAHTRSRRRRRARRGHLRPPASTPSGQRSVLPT